MNKRLATIALATGVLFAATAAARDVGVEITNLSNGTYFTPLLVAAHNRNTRLFELGSPASAHLQALAEGGDISGLATDVEAAGGVVGSNGGLLAPGDSASVVLEVRGRSTARMSIVAMLLPTNDGFVGLDSLRIPKHRGRYTYYLNGYDAGTEANDEIINGGGAPGVPGIPADPGANGGTNGSGVAGPDQNPNVHIHRGVLGDTDPGGGASDLDSRVHRWLNPVARVVVTVAGRGHRDDD